MIQEEYNKVVKELTEDRKQVAEGKREDYTKGDEDVLKNFKNQAEALGVDPKVSLAVHMEKQFSAVMNYIKTNGQSESEPIIKRIGDCINYLELLWGLIQEEQDKDFEETYLEMKDNVPSFCDTPNTCHHDGCMCERTDKFVEGEQRDITKRFVKSIYFHRKTDVFDVLYNNGYGKIIPEKDVIDIQQSYDSPNYLDWLETENEIYVVEDQLKGIDSAYDVDEGFEELERDTIGIKHGTEDLYAKLADKNNLIEVGSNVWKKEGDDSDLRWKLTKAGFQPLQETGRSRGI